METSAGNSPRTELRTGYRPKLVMDQKTLASLVPKPAFASKDTTTARAPSSSFATVLNRSGWSYRVGHAVNEIIRSHSGYKPDQEPIQGDMKRMFEATVSTLVLIASGDVNISPEHLLWSEAFLRGNRDRYGNHPPNVRKMLGFIKHIQGLKATTTTADGSSRKDGMGGDTSGLLAQTYRNAIPANVTLTKIAPPSSRNASSL